MASAKRLHKTSPSLFNKLIIECVHNWVCVCVLLLSWTLVNCDSHPGQSNRRLAPFLSSSSVANSPLSTFSLSPSSSSSSSSFSSLLPSSTNTSLSSSGNTTCSATNFRCKDGRCKFAVWPHFSTFPSNTRKINEF